MLHFCIRRTIRKPTKVSYP